MREVKGEITSLNFPTLYINKDKRGEKASFICFFAPFAIINFFSDNLLKFIVNLQPVIKI